MKKEQAFDIKFITRDDCWNSRKLICKSSQRFVIATEPTRLQLFTRLHHFIITKSLDVFHTAFESTQSDIFLYLDLSTRLFKASTNLPEYWLCEIQDVRKVWCDPSCEIYFGASFLHPEKTQGRSCSFQIYTHFEEKMALNRGFLALRFICRKKLKKREKKLFSFLFFLYGFSPGSRTTLYPSPATPQHACIFMNADSVRCAASLFPQTRRFRQ